MNETFIDIRLAVATMKACRMPAKHSESVLRAMWDANNERILNDQPPMHAWWYRRLVGRELVRRGIIK